MKRNAFLDVLTREVGLTTSRSGKIRGWTTLKGEVFICFGTCNYIQFYYEPPSEEFNRIKGVMNDNGILITDSDTGFLEVKLD